MTVTPMLISNTLVEIQAYLLARPGLALTAADIGRRSGRSLVLTRAVLDVLADAGVLDKSPDGAYSRRLPCTITQHSHRSGRATRAGGTESPLLARGSVESIGARFVRSWRPE